MAVSVRFFVTTDIIKYWSNNNNNKDRGSFDRNSLDQNCVLSLDQNFDNQLTEFLDAFQLIKTFNNDFGQTPKF
jgi:hypothetical protein